MDTTQILPSIGSPVSSPAFDESAIEDMSIGEVAYAAALFTRVLAKRVADPAAAHAFARFVTAPGADWSGFQPSTEPPVTADDDGDGSLPSDEGHAAQAEHQKEPEEESASQRRVPVAPENYYDSMPGIAHMLRQQQHATDAVLTYFAAHVGAVIHEQAVFLGTPVGINPYKDSAAYFRQVLKLSRVHTIKIHDRIPYVTWTPGHDPTSKNYQPTFLNVAQSFADGKISGENLDRIVSLDQDLTKYVQKTKALPDYKNDVMQAFEPALVDAAETATPDELSGAKTRWANTIAHAIDPDGPLVAEAIRKQADNAIRTQNMADGSGKISMHATAPIYAAFKNWVLHQLNFNGTPIEIPDDLLDLLKPEHGQDPGPEHPNEETGHAEQESDPDHENQEETKGTPHQSEQEPDPAAAFNDINDLKASPHPDATAQDADGNTIPADEAQKIDPLTTGQRLAAIVIGMFQNILTMDPTDLQAKSAHGASAQLMIVQDIQTAYETLGIGALPEAVRRPPGPAGVLPPMISQPNPDDPATPLCLDPDHTRGHSPPPWTSYMSEAVNIGPMPPKDAAQLACDSKLAGQIWNGTTDVLAQHRARRFFTPTQRRAILARDRGCQAPGCTLPAVYCQIHHIIAWQNNGPTNVDNAITLCAAHHAAIHNGKWTIRRHHGTTYFQPAPWLDPTQPLLRNLYWAL